MAAVPATIGQHPRINTHELRHATIEAISTYRFIVTLGCLLSLESNNDVPQDPPQEAYLTSEGRMRSVGGDTEETSVPIEESLVVTFYSDV